ncbi:hypothetical protein FVE85_8609 [Porphyridium purpureum]|uniref:Uncharacterized protein n=1 Tax=Porphyridium purpureum TaxID=35688 RepID=A0A5J4YR25_PORPP|nr:hypothetical protein FVE85_8609 [Porphyridium purpureum]|eukprot:POR9226..scf296_7
MDGFKQVAEAGEDGVARTVDKVESTLGSVAHAAPREGMEKVEIAGSAVWEGVHDGVEATGNAVEKALRPVAHDLRVPAVNEHAGNARDAVVESGKKGVDGVVEKTANVISNIASDVEIPEPARNVRNATKAEAAQRAEQTRDAASKGVTLNPQFTPEPPQPERRQQQKQRQSQQLPPAYSAASTGAAQPAKPKTRLKEQLQTHHSTLQQHASKLFDPRLMLMGQLCFVFFLYLIWPPLVQNPVVPVFLYPVIVATSVLSFFWKRIRPPLVPKYDAKVTPTRADIQYERWDKKKIEIEEEKIRKLEVSLNQRNLRYRYLRKQLRDDWTDIDATDSLLNDILLRGNLDVVEPDPRVEILKLRETISALVLHANLSYSERSLIIRQKQLLGFSHLEQAAQGRVNVDAEIKKPKVNYREHMSTANLGSMVPSVDVSKRFSTIRGPVSPGTSKKGSKGKDGDSSFAGLKPETSGDVTAKTSGSLPEEVKERTSEPKVASALEQATAA